MSGLNVKLDTTSSSQGPLAADSGNRIITAGRGDLIQASGSWDASTPANSSIVLSSSGHGTVLISFAGSPGGGVATFQGSVDGGVNWTNHLVVSANTFLSLSSASLGNLESLYRMNSAGFTHVRVLFTGAITSGFLNVILIGYGLPSTLPVTNLSFNLLPGIKKTYRATVLHYAPAATPTDVAVLPGSNTTTIKVVRISVQGFATTAGSMDLQIIRRGVDDTAGTSTNISRLIMDSINDPASFSIPRKYTVNPTINDTGVAIEIQKLAFPIAGTANQPLTFDFGNRAGAKALVLGAATQVCAINLNGGAVPTGGTISYTFEWTEE